MNVERMNTLADIIESVGEAQPVCIYASKWEGYSQEVYTHECGTPACIAGFAVAHKYQHDGTISSVDVHRVFERETGCSRQLTAYFHEWMVDTARDHLELTQDQAQELFDGQPFSVDGEDEEYVDPSPWDAVWTLREAARTGCVEWMRDES